MAQYQKDIYDKIKTIFDQFFIANAYSSQHLGFEELYVLMRWKDGISAADFLKGYGYERSKGQRIIADLTRERLIEKQRDPSDGRKRCLRRTALGLEVSRNCEQTMLETTNKLLRDLSLNEEKAVLKFISNLEKLK